MVRDIEGNPPQALSCRHSMLRQTAPTARRVDPAGENALAGGSLTTGRATPFLRQPTPGAILILIVAALILIVADHLRNSRLIATAQRSHY